MCRVFVPSAGMLAEPMRFERSRKLLIIAYFPRDVQWDVSVEATTYALEAVKEDIEDAA